MMLRSFAEAGAALERPDYLDAAINNANFLLETMRPDGKLLRTYRVGQARLPGYLEDYSFVADGLLALYESTFDQKWLTEATSIADRMIELFWNDDVGGFYDTSSEHDQLVIRPRDVLDNAQPCGGSVATDMLLKLAVITGNENYRIKAVTPLRTLKDLMSRAPTGTGHWLAALDFYVSSPKEVVIIGPHNDPATEALLKTVNGNFHPNKVLVGAEAPGEYDLPLLESRGMIDGKPTAYVCQNYTCQVPVTTPEELAIQLEQ